MNMEHVLDIVVPLERVGCIKKTVFCVPFSPKADTSWLLDSGEENECECKNLPVAKCCSRSSDPQSTGSLPK